LPRIPDSFIDELTARTDIVELVSGYVKLTKRTGAHEFGLCPFHSEKTPSFSVNRDKQIYYCFGCGHGGGAVNFIREIENLPFIDAVAFLAKRAGMQMPDTGSREDASHRTRLLELNRDAARFYHELLSKPQGASAVRYMEKRKIPPKIARSFGLGVAPDAWNTLTDAMRALGYTDAEMIEAGLAKRSTRDGAGSGVYDTFRDRLMFPVIDISRNVIGFSGRILGDGEPKYLNSPDTPVFSKSRNLFALNFAKSSKAGMLILTEGNIDVISLHAAGVDCAVASLGTSLTGEQARLMSRYTKKAVICYDNDAAGAKATERAIGILEKTDMEVRVLRVEGAKDPDEFIQAFGVDAFRDLLAKSENHVEFRLRGIAAATAPDTDEHRVEYLQKAAETLADIASAPEREVFGRTVAANAGVSYEAVESEVKRIRAARAKKDKSKQTREETRPKQAVQPTDRNLRYGNENSAVAEEGVIRCLAADEATFAVAREARLTAEEFSSPLLGKVYALLAERDESGGRLSEAALAAQLEPAEASHITYLLSQPVSAADADRAIRDYINKIREEAAINAAKQSGDTAAALLAMQKSKQKKERDKDNGQRT
jgi:DNA primase